MNGIDSEGIILLKGTCVGREKLMDKTNTLSGASRHIFNITMYQYLISSFRRVLYVVCFLLGNYPAYKLQTPGNYPKESIHCINTFPTAFQCEFISMSVRNKTFCDTLMMMTSLVVWWSELLTTKHEVPGSISGSTMGIFFVGGGSLW